MPINVNELRLAAHFSRVGASTRTGVITYDVYCAALNTLDPSVQTAFSIPGALGVFIDHMKSLMHDLIDGLKIGIKDIITALKQKNIFALLKAIGFNLNVLVKAFVKLLQAGPKMLIHTLQQLEEDGWLDKLKSGAARVDEVLNAYPVLKKVGGVVIGALLIYLWTRATFTGHPDTDLNLEVAIKAVCGHYDVAQILGDPANIAGLLLGVSGIAGLDLGIAWMGHVTTDASAHAVTAMNLAMALVATGLIYAGKKGLADKLKPYMFGKGDIDKKFHDVPESEHSSFVSTASVALIASRLATS